MKKKQYERNGFVSFLKFLFISMIVMFHYGVTLFDGEKWFIFRGAAILTEFFFFISGYYLTVKAINYNGKHLGKDTWNYISNKFFRIFPYFFIGFIASLYVYFLYNDFTFVKLSKTVWNLLCFNTTGIKFITINGPSWYISVLIISSLILYPLISKYKDKYIYLIAPLIFILGFGYLDRMPKSLGTWNYYNGFIMKGLLRGFVAMNLGCFLYCIISKIKEIKFTKLGYYFFNTLCFITLFIPIYIITFVKEAIDYNTFVIFFLILIAFFSLSEKTCFNKLFNNKFIYFLEKISLSLFLTHDCVYNFIISSGIFNNLRYRYALIIYYCIALTLAIIIYLIVNYLKKKEILTKIKLKLIEY